MSDTFSERAPREGETCTCGRPAVTIYVITDENGTREVPYCGIADGGANSRGTGYADSDPDGGAS